ncbi:MAG: DUF4105 domain-containing protein [Planctomycetaceae bacterium]|jgi:hypothetical protein|nr:DUF4105 domain-containing protein [Planctomycetaceae bacterium]
MSLCLRFHAGFAFCLLLGGSGCVAQPHHLPPASPMTANNPLPAQPESALSAAVPVGLASPDLYRPWNIQEFAVRTREPNGTYRLVSDTQPVPASPESVPAKTPPPPSRLLLQDPPQNRTAAVSPAPPAVRPTLLQAVAGEFRPSNHRKWSQNHAVLQTADFKGNWVTVRNVRYSKYESAEKYTTRYYDATFNLEDIRTIDLIMVPFRGTPRLAHVESSFGFADGRQLALSIEARYEENEKYDPLGAGLRQFELIYVFADERDMIRLGTDAHNNDVYIYRLKFEPKEVRAMFVDALQRANKLAVKPEFYHPLANSCVTNLIAHINKGRPQSVPREYRTVIPGLLDNYLFDLKLMAVKTKTFKETKENAKVNWLVEKYGDLEYFSAGIRQNMLR